MFILFTTDTGIKVYGVAFQPKALLLVIDDLFERHFVGADPFKIEHHFRHIYGAWFSQRPDPTMMDIILGIEIALWDIISKARDKPAYDLLGDKITDRLSYTYLNAPIDAPSNQPVYDNAIAAAEQTLEYAEPGVTALKFDPALPYTHLIRVAFQSRRWSLPNTTPPISARLWAVPITC